MKLQYTLQENDFVTNQLFFASKSDRIRKKRLRSKWSIPLVYALLAFVLFAIDLHFAAILLLLVAVLWPVLYPMYERRHYVNHYRKFVAENYKSAAPEVITVDIGDKDIHMRSHNSESRIALGEIKGINEIDQLILIRLNGPHTIIIPKYFLPGADDLITELKNIAARLSIPYHEELNWKWT